MKNQQEINFIYQHKSIDTKTLLWEDIQWIAEQVYDIICMKCNASMSDDCEICNWNTYEEKCYKKNKSKKKR